MDQFKFVRLANLENVFSFDNDLPYPDWKVIGEHIRSRFSKELWPDAWNEAVDQWLQKLATALGQDYMVNQSPNFFTMSCRDGPGRRQLIDTTEQLRGRILERLKGIDLRKTYGKHVVLLFGDPAQYYQYVSHYSSDGNHIQSAGIFLRSSGYAHIAMPDTQTQIIRTLSHELAHNLLMTLPLPLWLNEGMAKSLETGFSSSRDCGLNADLAERHFAFWDNQNIQDFWSGRAFDNPEMSELAYSLASVLLGLITQENWDLQQFVQHAEYADAGEKAAENHLGRTLGELAGIFLGPGEWSPKPPWPSDQEEDGAKQEVKIDG